MLVLTQKEKKYIYITNFKRSEEVSPTAAELLKNIAKQYKLLNKMLNTNYPLIQQEIQKQIEYLNDLNNIITEVINKIDDTKDTYNQIQINNITRLGIILSIKDLMKLVEQLNC
ncbi:hypothetical protein EOL94_04435 [bacterium]|nr:hypothetical protein [bacterium]